MAALGAPHGPGAGRFAPSPTGHLHVGNLRTALLSWLVARRAGAEWMVRMEDLDPVTSSPEVATAQLTSLAVLGLRSDRPVVFQSQRFDVYEGAIARLQAAGLTYDCFCTRREIREAAQAPHDALAEHQAARAMPDGAYPGTCRELATDTRRRFVAEGRRPALRLRTDGQVLGFDDEIAGRVDASIDDVVLRRNDGVAAYNLAVVVDDAAQGITEVVRGDDLATSTPRQILLQRLLGLPTLRYAHVPLVVGTDGVRIAKRRGGVTLADLAAVGISSRWLLALLAASLGQCARSDDVTLDGLLAGFDIGAVPRDPCRLADLLAGIDLAGAIHDV
ncbi:MAG: tRNA glutamyl-Q(34) synthetase GluQRS [Ilumatobacteraceae bacterium]